MENLLKVAINELGIEEYSGIDNNLEVLKYAHDTGIDWITEDETPWCSTFVNWCAMKCKLPQSGKANARSWLNVGIKTSDPLPGDVVVFWRETLDSEKGHVAFFLGFNQDSSRVFVVGGNQANRVSITSYQVDHVLSYQRLVKSDELTLPEPVLRKGNVGAEVKKLQRALKAIGIVVGAVDGVYGRKTVRGVMELQARDGHVALDGIYGTGTRNQLLSILQQ
jgi:uncharacterized protein (TIGR02594 family)